MSGHAKPHDSSLQSTVFQSDASECAKSPVSALSQGFRPMRRSASSRFREIPSRDEEESLASSRLSSEEHSQAYSYGQSVPSTPRQIRSSRPSEADLRSRLPSRTNMDESVGLLSSQNYRQQSYNSFTSLTPGTPRQTTATHTSTSQSLRLGRHHGRSATFAQRLVNAIGPERRPTTYGKS